MLVGRELFFQKRHCLPGRQPFERSLYITFLNACGFVCPKQEHTHGVLIDRLCVLCPAQNGGIANVLAVVTVSKQAVQCSGISKGGVLADRGVIALLVAVGAEGRCVEGYQRCAGALRPGHAADIGMGALDGGIFSGNQALPHVGIGGAVIVVRLPCVLNGRVVIDKTVAVVGSFVAKDQVGIAGDLLPLLLQQGMRGSLRRVPAVKISKERPGCGAVHAVQNGVMQFGTGLEAIRSALRLAFFVCAQQIRGVIAQKVGCNAGGTLFMRRYAHGTRGKDCFFAHLCFCAQVEHGNKLPGIVQAQLITYLKAVIPAGGRKLALPDKLLVIGSKCL